MKASEEQFQTCLNIVRVTRLQALLTKAGAPKTHTGILRGHFHRLCADAEHACDMVFAEADDDIVIDTDDRYAELPGEIDHLLALLYIGADIVFGVCDVMLRKEFLCEVAKMTVLGAIDGDCFHMPQYIMPVRNGSPEQFRRPAQD